MEFFNRDKKDITDSVIDQSIIDFMNQNAQEDPNDSDPETAKNMEIQKKLNQNQVGDCTHKIENLAVGKDSTWHTYCHTSRQFSVHKYPQS